MAADWDADESEDRPRDPAIDRAIARLDEFFEAAGTVLHYSTQIETNLEREFFHWITGKALRDLSAGRRIQRSTVEVHGNPVNFYAEPRHRYWRREQRMMTTVLAKVYDPEFAQAVGRHGELMFDAALGRAGFRTEAQNTKSWNGVTWEDTNHNLDRIITRDGLSYGVEIKNTQNYISREELRTKLDLCRYISVTPLFIMRFAPKSYIHQVVQAGGFVLLFEEQIYPFGQSALLSEVRQHLRLKVQSPRDVKDGDIQRLLRWHERRLS